MIEPPKKLRKMKCFRPYGTQKKQKIIPKRSFYLNLYQQYDYFERKGRMQFTNSDDTKKFLVALKETLDRIGVKLVSGR